MKKMVTKHSDWVRAALGQFETPLLRYATGITGNVETAREVVQDVFLKLCTADRVKVDGHLAQWLYTVCRNRALDIRKKEGRMQPMNEAQARALRSNAPEPSTVAERHETHSMVLEVLAGLPEEQQEAFRLKFQHGLTYREISGVMKKPLSSVSYTLTAALKSLRQQLEGKLDLATDG